MTQFLKCVSRDETYKPANSSLEPQIDLRSAQRFRTEKENSDCPI